MFFFLYFIKHNQEVLMKIQKFTAIAIVLGSIALLTGCMGKAAASYWDGKKFSILESHWGAPTETRQNDDGSTTAIFRAGDDCTATFNMDAQGVILNHDIVGGSCSYDAYNRLLNIEH